MMNTGHHRTGTDDYRRAHPAEYSRALFNAWKLSRNVREACTDYRDLRGHPPGVQWWLAGDRASGFGVTPDGELVGVFSVVKGRGDKLVGSAVYRGAEFLDCFDGYLPTLYARHGFVEEWRDRNWTPGGPDVVFMTRRPGARPLPAASDPSLGHSGSTNPEGGYTP